VRQDRKPSPLLIEHENLDDKIYARLKRMIAEGELSPGQRILQEKLARDMGVSRTPLVNALKRLAQERLWSGCRDGEFMSKRFSMWRWPNCSRSRRSRTHRGSPGRRPDRPGRSEKVQADVRRVQQETVCR